MHACEPKPVHRSKYNLWLFTSRHIIRRKTVRRERINCAANLDRKRGTALQTMRAASIQADKLVQAPAPGC